MASMTARSRPSEKLGTRSTSFAISELSLSRPAVDRGHRPWLFRLTVYDTLTVALLPALSTAVTLNVCLPSVLVSMAAPDATGPRHEAMPEPESWHAYFAR